MNSFRKDYTKLYLLQNRFLKWWCDLALPFYLTGGTALGRFYLNHRYSEDLDYIGKPATYQFGMIDTPMNILSNKLTAIIGPDESKDIFDIIHLSLNYSFNWLEIFNHAKEKAVINELDVEQRIVSFPVEWLESVHWLNTSFNLESTRKILIQIADDFLLGKPNSLGKDKIPIEMAKPFVIATK